MFGFVVANAEELTKEQLDRYRSVYCGICRRIQTQSGNTCRLGLSYDMAFLALVLTALYEPEERTGKKVCMLHPIGRRQWVTNPYIGYAADMNVALSYYKAMDDYQDEHKTTAKIAMGIFEKGMDRIVSKYPRQCKAMEDCIRELTKLERSRCDNPDLPASCFGRLMAELFVYDEEDYWADALGKIGFSLGRFIYLADAAIDYRRDEKKRTYNPFAAMGTGEDWQRWEEYLVLEMGRCTDVFERLPLVQNTDKVILDNILYSGIWMEYRRQAARSEK